MSNFQIKCTLHNIEFGAAGIPTHEIDCPKCSRIERNRLAKELAEVKAHRDALVQAIEIKILLTPITG